jgi:SOS-response transcriptional repressor LexA
VTPNFLYFFLAKRTNVPYIKNMSITDRQKEVLEFIGAFQAREGFPPSIREICRALGLTSPGSLSKHLRALEAEGFLTGIPGKKRAWKLTHQPKRTERMTSRWTRNFSGLKTHLPCELKGIP